MFYVIAYTFSCALCVNSNYLYLYGKMQFYLFPFYAIHVHFCVTIFLPWFCIYWSILSINILSKYEFASRNCSVTQLWKSSWVVLLDMFGHLDCNMENKKVMNMLISSNNMLYQHQRTREHRSNLATFVNHIESISWDMNWAIPILTWLQIAWTNARGEWSYQSLRLLVQFNALLWRWEMTIKKLLFYREF